MTAQTMSTPPNEAMFIPIDLEASLGRIEDSLATVDDDDDRMLLCEPLTRTSNNNPFRTMSEETITSDQHMIAPYPYSETDTEIKERQRLAETVVSSWPISMDVDDKQQGIGRAESELIPTEGDDDFSLCSEDAASLNPDDLQFEKIQDPASFFETVTANSEQPNIIPFSVSVSSIGHSSEQSPEV